MEDLAGTYPIRASVAWVEEEGLVVVLLPKRLDPVSRALRRLTRGPAHLRVPLDEVGSQAFRLADGSRTAAALAADLERAFAERAGPAERAMGFIAILARNRLLLLARQPAAAPPPRLDGVRLLACPRCARGFHVAEGPGTRLRCPACGGRVEG